MLFTATTFAQDIPTSTGSVLTLSLPMPKVEAEKKIQVFEKKPFFVKTYSGEFIKVEYSTLLKIVEISEEKVGETTHATLTIRAIDNLSETLGHSINRSTQHTTLVPHEDRYSVVGVLQDGYSLDTYAFGQLLSQALLSEDEKTRAIELPMIKHEGTVYIENSSGEKEAVSRVGQGESDFSGSTQSRIHNIQTAMETMNGFVIPQGDTFSFNDHLGEVDGSTGYKMELVIKGAETIPEFGGGVCQFSSTVYRAALYTGLPIAERKPHSYAVSYYEPWGSDATIYPGVVDLRFTNNLPGPIILHTYIDGKKLYVNFYGKGDGRTVEMSGPNIYGHQQAPAPKVEYTTSLAPGKRVWKAYGHNGFAAWWERKITSGSGEVMTEKINSIYEARPGVVVEGKAVTVTPDEAI